GPCARPGGRAGTVAGGAGRDRGETEPGRSRPQVEEAGAMNAFVDDVLQPALVFLGEWSLRWGVLIAVLALGLLRLRRPATRHLLCFAVLLAGILLPAVPSWGPGWLVPDTPPPLPAGEGGTDPVEEIEPKADVLLFPAKPQGTETPRPQPAEAGAP